MDVVIVGARAAGAATALLLARAGLSVLVVDRERPGADTLSTHALMRGAVVQLHRWGLLGDVIRAGTPAIRETTFHYATESVWLPIKPGGGVDALYAPRRTVLDPILVAAAQDAGAVVRYGAALVGVRTGGGRVTGVEVRDRHGRVETITAAMVIGADGRRSTLARLVSAPITHHAAHTTACAYGYYRDLPCRGYEWAYRTSGMAGLIPTNDATCVFVAQRPGRLARHRAGLEAAVADASPDLAERLRAAEPTSPVRTFVGQPGYLRQPWGPGWALVGDAGSWKDPISAHGLTDALRDAELLAGAAVRVLAGEASEAEAFGHYQATRDRLTLPILTGSAEIAALQWDDERIRLLLRELNLAMSDELRVIEKFGEVLINQVPAAAHPG
ncbi:MAG: FAD-dependent monooxygenase [Micropruina sp.]|uniref:NAD(P)/FAD-dependent oxidoreductase n=1 Tax=Micropruina sp. TaxID=2737536 RepID=UPI0039E5B1DE